MDYSRILIFIIIYPFTPSFWGSNREWSRKTRENEILRSWDMIFKRVPGTPLVQHRVGANQNSA